MNKEFYEQKKVREMLNSSDDKIKRFNNPFYIYYIEQKVSEIINYTNMRLNK